ncbi:MAG: HlyD family efflux transporter periplasmic adaptor subunit [Bryobacteraceae bacterium]
MKTSGRLTGFSAAVGICIVSCGMASCGASAQPAANTPKAEPPAKVSGPLLKEGELATITLTPEAEQRLGVRLASVAAASTGEVRRFAADVTLPPGRSLLVAAPVSGILRGNLPPTPGAMLARNQTVFTITPLLPIPRDLRVTAEADLAQAKTRMEAARLRKARADRLLKDEVGTVRAQEDAGQELDLSTAALEAAQTRLDQIKRAPLEGDVTIDIAAPRDGMLRQILALPGQSVTAGAPLFEIADLSSLWLRVPVYAGEAELFTPGASVNVETLSGALLGAARPVPAPPTGDPLAATVDFYYEVPASARHAWKPGEKVFVAVRSRLSRDCRAAPFSAIVYDIHGGTWVYEKAAAQRYVRRRVQIDHTAGSLACLVSGPPNGAEVVTEGAAELWGVEFGAGK